MTFSCAINILQVNSNGRVKLLTVYSFQNVLWEIGKYMVIFKRCIQSFQINQSFWSIEVSFQYKFMNTEYCETFYMTREEAKILIFTR